MRAEGIGAGCGCLIVLTQMAVSIAIIYTIVHFVLKFW